MEAGDGDEASGEGVVRLLDVGGDSVNIFLKVLVEKLYTIGRAHAL